MRNQHNGTIKNYATFGECGNVYICAYTFKYDVWCLFITYAASGKHSNNKNLEKKNMKM